MTARIQSLHYEFLSQIKPVYLLRTRAYSRTISKKPFLVNYQGAQFRVYPGIYQCLLDVGSRYKRVRGANERKRGFKGRRRRSAPGMFKRHVGPCNIRSATYDGRAIPCVLLLRWGVRECLPYPCDHD